jgi:hypothetical protein
MTRTEVLCAQVDTALSLSLPAVKKQRLSLSGVPALCEKFPHSSQLIFEYYLLSTELIFNQLVCF